jgi:hypothetical protein
VARIANLGNSKLFASKLDHLRRASYSINHLIEHVTHSTRPRSTVALFSIPAPFVRSFSFDDNRQRVAGGSAVVLPGPADISRALAAASDADDFSWSDAQTAAFLAGDPLTLGWVTESPAERGQERVYVCCWVTIEND